MSVVIFSFQSTMCTVLNYREGTYLVSVRYENCIYSPIFVHCFNKNTREDYTYYVKDYGINYKY